MNVAYGCGRSKSDVNLSSSKMFKQLGSEQYDN
jgi:hypothetical protein